MKEKVICILGPTAVGKTKLGVELAKQLNTEIISGDSAQVYRGLDIGTAKVTIEAMEGIPHHLIDINDVDEAFSVYDFQKLVREKIHEINQRGRVPILVGGTGLYVRAVLYDYQFIDEGRNEDFLKVYDVLSNEDLHEKLREVDETSANVLHPNNRRRVMRALEIAKTSNNQKSELLLEDNPEPLYDAYLIGLELERSTLYDRINKRVDQMMDDGLLVEVKRLYDEGHRPHIIGYKELYPYFEGEISLDDAIEEIKKRTRRLAKRQMTFFRHQFNLNYYQVFLDNFNQTIEEVSKDVSDWLKK